jgi:hypothetical protein
VPSFPRSRWCVEAGEGRARRAAPALLLRSARPCPSSLPAGVREEDGARISLFGGEGAGRSRAHPSGREGAGRVEELTAAGRLRLRWRGVRAGKAAGGAAASLSTHPSVLEGGAAASPSSCGGQAVPLLVGCRGECRGQPQGSPHNWGKTHFREIIKTQDELINDKPQPRPE